VSCSSRVKIGEQLTVRSVKSLEPSAFAEARKWRPDAFLSRVTVNPIKPDSGTRSPYADILAFDFRSDSETQHSALVEFRLDGGVGLTEWFTVSPYLDYVPIEPKDWTIDSIDAWRIAQENGGSEFFLRNPAASAFAYLTLERQTPPRSGPVLWRVGYSNYGTGDYKQGAYSLFILLDAKTGTVVSKEFD
jgi:hypothetical protein